MLEKKKKRSRKKLFKLTHKYYERTGFYMFVWESLKKAFLPILGLVIAVFLFNKYVYNINEGLENMTETFPREAIFAFFFVSETILGLIPPEIFIAWTKKTNDPLVNLSILAVLSYSGGLLSYHIGKLILKIESVRVYLEVKMAKHLRNSKKWGGILIMVGALLPLPFSIACMASGMIKYPFKNVIWFGLFRLVRFGIYGWAIFQVVT